MKKLISLMAVIVILTVTVLALGTSVQATSDTILANVNVKYGQTEARTMLKMINDFRKSNEAWYLDSNNAKVTCTGLADLTYDYDLEKIAMQRATEIAVYYSHTRPNGKICFTCTYNGKTSMGENIAAGQLTANSVFVDWREDNENFDGQGHRRNMLGINDNGTSLNYTAVGIGHVYYNGVHYWVQEFGTSNSGTASTVANNSQTDVKVEIAKANVTAMTNKVSNENLKLEVGSKVIAPTIKTTIRTSEGWPAGRNMTVNMENTWNISDPTIIKLENGEIVGLKPGKTTLISSIDSKLVVNVEVTKKSIASATVELEANTYKYDKTAKTPTVVKVILKGEELPKSNYQVSYKNNIAVGTASVIITGVGDYEGTKTVEFAITCDHPTSQRKVKGAVTPTEERAGYTGDLVCEYCGQLIEEGKVLPQLKPETEKNINENKSEENNEPTTSEIKTNNVQAKNSEVPKLGDSPLELWIALVIISAVGIVVSIRFIIQKNIKD